MRKESKMPLAVYVLFHSEYLDGEAAFDKMYQLLCRDVGKPLIDGIDIPVYLRTDYNGKILNIDFSVSEKTAVVVLIDERMFCSQLWRDYIDGIVSKDGNAVKIYCIGLCNYAFEITEKIGKIQAIKLKNYVFGDNWREIQIRLLESLFRFLTDSNSRARLFISHAKKDSECLAKELRDYLASSTKLRSFFDENDILDGEDFETQLVNGVKTSLLVVLKTDCYSEREWCRKEVVVAKKNGVPIIVLNCVKHVSKRLFPYLGNCPMVQYPADWSEMIIILLKTALNRIYQYKLLSALKCEGDEVIPCSPELFSFVAPGVKGCRRVLYPEPPLGVEELEILTEFDKKICFVTPTEVRTEAVVLTDKNIGFSISEPDDMHQYGCSACMLRDLVLELSRYILKSGAKLAYGGDLRKEGYTESFEDFSYQYGRQERSSQKPYYFTNYFAWPIHLAITESVKAELIHNRVCVRVIGAPDNQINENKYLPPVGNENRLIWARSLTKMRKEMESELDARIFIGGRLFGFQGRIAGVIEEFLIASEKEHPVYLIGGFGGATRAIVDIVEEKEVDLKAEAEKDSSYAPFADYYNEHAEDRIDYDEIVERIRGASFNNGLTDIENRCLFYSNDISRIVSLILIGLNRKLGLKIKSE